MTANVNRALFVICVGVVVIGASLPSMAQAPSPGLLPPFPTPPPGPTPTPLPLPQSRPGSLAWIELRLQPVDEALWQIYFWQDLWTVVQWQDLHGMWHDVTGWQGTLDEVVDGVGRKTWWVASADLAKGPFRWVVYQTFGGPALLSSEPFDLPAASGTGRAVEVTLGADQ